MRDAIGKMEGIITIDFLDFSKATYNALIKQGIDTPKKIANLTDKEIDRLRAIGEKRKKEVLIAKEKCKEFKTEWYDVTLKGKNIGRIEIETGVEVRVEVDAENKEIKINP